MENNLVLILRSFSKKEMKELEKLVKSPFFSTGRDVMPLFKYMAKHHPELEESKMEREVIFKNLYKGKPYNDQLMRTMMSELLRLCKEYLTQQRLNEVDIYRDFFLLSQLNERRADKMFGKEMKLLEEKLEKERFDTTGYFYYKLQKEYQKISHYIVQDDDSYFHKNISGLGRDLAGNILEDLSYCVNVIKAYSKTVNSKNDLEALNDLINKVDYESLLQKIKQHSYDDFLKSSIDYYSMMCNLHNDEKNFYKFKDLLISNLSQMNKNFAYNAFSHLDRACSELRRTNREKFAIELFQSGLLQLENKLYSHKSSPYMASRFFTSFLSRGFDIGRYEWVISFTAEYTDKLPPEAKNHMSLYADAFNYFCKGNYQKALGKIAAIPADEIKFMTDIKRLALMSYYEAGMVEEAYYNIDAYRHFLNENKYISEASRTANMDFLKYYSLLLKNTDRTEKIITSNFIKQVSASLSPNVFWLKEKAEELV